VGCRSSQDSSRQTGKSCLKCELNAGQEHWAKNVSSQTSSGDKSAKMENLVHGRVPNNSGCASGSREIRKGVAVRGEWPWVG